MCHVSRHNTLRQRSGSTPGHPQSGGAPPPPAAKHKAGEKAEKGEKLAKRPQTPFHHRSALCEEPAPDPDPAGPRMGLRPHDPPRFTPPAKSAPPDAASSPPPPPLSPHPCERGDEGPHPAKPAPHGLHFYPPVSSEPCPAHTGSEALPLHGLTPPFPPPCPPPYPEALEPTLYVGAAIRPRHASCSPWRFFNLPRRKDGEVPTPLLPADHLRDEPGGTGGADGLVSITE